MSSEPLRSRIYNEVIKEWCETTTTHGIPHIISTRNLFIRALWVFFFLTSFSYCSYTIIKSLVQYFQYDTNVQINVIRDSPAEFPAVTICNLMPYDYFKTDNNVYINSILQQNNLTYGIDLNKVNSVSDPRELYQNFFTKLKTLIARDAVNRTDLKENLGYDLETHMLLSCSYNKITCHASDFSSFWSNDYGTCYTFNSGKDKYGKPKEILKTNKVGIDYGLQLELLVVDPEKYIQFAYKLGIFMIVHNRTVPPFMITEGINVPTGSDTFVPITKTHYSKLPEPYSNCVDSLNKYKKVSTYASKLYNYMTKLNLTYYDQEFCYKLCFQDRLTDTCGCSDISLPLINNKLYCINDTEVACQAVLNQQFATENVENLCYQSCPTQCEKTKYDLYDHKALYPTEYYFDQLLNAGALVKNTSSPLYILRNSYNALTNAKYSYDLIIRFVRDSIVKVTVNYNDFTYTSIEDNPTTTFETLLGILGGQLGLFIGMSFLSLIELVELSIRIMLILFHRTKKPVGIAQTGQTKTDAATTQNGTTIAPPYLSTIP